MNTVTSHEYNGMMGITPPDQGLDLEYLDTQAEAALQAKNQKLASLFVNTEQILSRGNVDQYYADKLKELNLHPADLALYLFEPQNFVQIIDSSPQAILPSFFYDIWARNPEKFIELYKSIDKSKQLSVIGKLLSQRTGYVDKFLDIISGSLENAEVKNTVDSQEVLSGIPSFFTEISSELSQDDDLKSFVDELRDTQSPEARAKLKQALMDMVQSRFVRRNDQSEDSRKSDESIESLQSVEDQVDELSEVFFERLSTFNFDRTDFAKRLMTHMQDLDSVLRTILADMLETQERNFQIVTNPLFLVISEKNAAKRALGSDLKRRLLSSLASESPSRQTNEGPKTQEQSVLESQALVRATNLDEEGSPELSSAKDRLVQNLNKLLAIDSGVWTPVLKQGESLSDVLSQARDPYRFLSFNTNVFPDVSRTADTVSNAADLDQLSTAYDQSINRIDSIVQTNLPVVRALTKIVELGKLIVEDYQVIYTADDKRLFADLFEQFNGKFKIGTESWRMRTVLGNIRDVVAEAEKSLEAFSTQEERSRNQISEKAAAQERKLILQNEKFKSEYEALKRVVFDREDLQGQSNEFNKTVEDLVEDDAFYESLQEYRRVLVDSTVSNSTKESQRLQLSLMIQDTLLKNWPKRIPATTS